jgi:hypothetical protein
VNIANTPVPVREPASPDHERHDNRHDRPHEDAAVRRRFGDVLGNGVRVELRESIAAWSRDVSRAPFADVAG